MRKPFIVAALSVVLAGLGILLFLYSRDESGIPGPPPAGSRPNPAVEAGPSAPAHRPPAPPPPPPVVPDPPAPPRRARAVISVFGPDGKPVVGALVTLVQRVPTVEQGPTTEARTGADGTAVFGDLTGTYFEVRAKAAGLVEGEGWIQSKPGTDSTREFHLERDHALHGRITIAGRAEPLPKALVVVHRTGDMPFFRGPPLASVETDADGRFRAEGIPMDERVAVLASASGFVAARRLVALSSADTESEEIEISLEPGGSLEGTLRDAEGVPVGKAIVLVAEEEPDADETNGVPHLLESPGRASNGRMAFETRTADDGTFAVQGLPLEAVYAAAAITADNRRSSVERGISPTAGSPRARRDLRLLAGALLRVRILGPDGKPPRGAAPDFPDEGYEGDRWTCVGPGAFEARVADPGPKLVEATAFEFAYETRTIEIPASGVVEAEFRLQEGVAIEGVVVDQDGKPLEGVGLEPDGEHGRGEGHDPMRNRRYAVSGAGGKFRIVGLRPGVYTVHTRIGEEFRIDRERRIQAPSTEVKIVVPRAASAVVRLTLPEGRTPPDTVEFGRWEIREHGRSGSTDHAPWNGGTIRWADLPPGKVQLTVHAKGFNALAFDLQVAPGTEVDLGSVALAGAVPLEIRVTDPSGKPVSGVRVIGSADPMQLEMMEGLPEEMLEHMGRGQVLRATTGEDGRCTFGAVESPEVILKASKTGFLATRLTVRPVAGSPTGIVLRRGGLLKGTVLLADGTRPRSAILVFTRSGGDGDSPRGGSWILDPPGVFEIRLGAGSWRVEAREALEGGAQGAKGAADVSLEEGGTGEVEIRMTR